MPDVSSELNNVNATIQETLHATKITTDEELIPVGKKTEGGEEILKEVTCFMQQKLTENLPEPPVSDTSERENTRKRACCPNSNLFTDDWPQNH